MRLRLAALALGAIILAGCGGSTATPNGSNTSIIKLGDMQFQPASITVKAGTTVTFTNTETITHDVVQTTPAQVGQKPYGFDSGPIAPGKSWSRTFETPGVYPILCTQGLHYTAGMVGTITVTK